MTIKVYSTPTCPICDTLKDYLHSKKISFETINVSFDDARREMVEKSGQIKVPVVDIDGTIIIGFDYEKINRCLNL